jgi:DNA-binding LacI/PurR family transcriptional regulator
VLRETGTPAVLIGLPRDTARLTCVDLDFDATGGACVDHLADLGHRDIAFIGESSGVYRRHTGFAARTLTGFQRRVAERGLRAVHRACEGTYESTAGVLARILEERPATTGFVVQNEAAVAPLLSLLRLSRRVVPEDSSVVAICAEQVALQSLPPLTSVSIPAEEMGRIAVHQALAQVEGDRQSSVLLVPSPLTVRESSGVAPIL